MPAFDFQPRFADAITAGRKTQTVRAYRKDGRDPRVGERLKLFSPGRRTGACRLVGVGMITSVEPVRICAYGDTPEVAVGHAPVDADEFAAQDGFPCARDMAEFFRNVHGLPFEGLRFRWRLLPAELPELPADTEPPDVPWLRDKASASLFGPGGPS